MGDDLPEGLAGLAARGVEPERLPGTYRVPDDIARLACQLNPGARPAQAIARCVLRLGEVEIERGRWPVAIAATESHQDGPEGAKAALDMAGNAGALIVPLEG